MGKETEIIIFEDQNVKLEVNLQDETVWLTQKQMAELFEKDRRTITRHIQNIYKDGELQEDSVCSYFEHTAEDGKTYQVQYYNLDMIISVGYRVNSKRGIAFRKWASNVLKNYIIQGYAVNHNRMNQLNEVLRVMRRVENSLDTKQVLNVVQSYSEALGLLDAYDHQNMTRPDGNQASYVLSYEECRQVIDSLRFKEDSDLFGLEKDDSFKGSIGAVYQSFAGSDLYPTLEEKAANLLYFIT